MFSIIIQYFLKKRQCASDYVEERKAKELVFVLLKSGLETEIQMETEQIVDEDNAERMRERTHCYCTYRYLGFRLYAGCAS